VGICFLFLRNAMKPIIPKSTAAFSYGNGPLFGGFHRRLLIKGKRSYACVFDGKEIAQKCDLRTLRVCTDYIKLPTGRRLFSSRKQTIPPFGCRWGRKGVFVSLLDTPANPRSDPSSQLGVTSPLHSLNPWSGNPFFSCLFAGRDYLHQQRELPS